MIEGLKLKVTSNELRQHCSERSAYHRGRASQKENELPVLKEALEKIKAGGGVQLASVSHMNKGGYHLDTESTVEALENDIRDHKNKTLVFAFYAEHLFDEDYTLQDSDLQRLEILKRW